MSEARISVSLPDGRMTPPVPLSVAKKALEQVTGRKIEDAPSDQVEAFSKDETGETHVGNVAAAELRQFIERIERLEEEKATIADDIKDVIGEAKSRGYDAKAIRTIIRLRKKDANERLEEEAILQTYMAALGME